jgi:hypothetical protein
MRSRRSKLVVLFLLIATIVFAACGGAEDNPGATFPGGNDSGSTFFEDAGDGSLFGQNDVAEVFFDPAQATLQVDGTTPKSATFTLKAKSSGGTITTVLAESVQFDRPDLAVLSAGPPVSLTAPGQFGGSGNLQGVYKGKVAKAKLTVDVHVRELGAGVSPSQQVALDAPNLPADTALTKLLYPYDLTVFPLGLSSPLVMWTAPAANDVYRLRYSQTNYTYDSYFVATAPARARIPQAAWDRITASNGGDKMKITLSRFSVSASAAFTSAKEEWTIAPSSLRGAIYYWTTSQGGHLSRIRPGTGAQPEVLNNGKCMGCHAVSADGSTLVASVEGQVTNDGSNDNRAWVAFDLPQASIKRVSTYFAGNLAVTPNGKYTVFGTQALKIAETATGVRNTTSGLETMQGTYNGLMTPAFSPDGKKLTAVAGNGSWYHNLTGGKLVVIDFNEATVAFSNRKDLADASSFPANQRAIAYPSFSPDSQWVSFHVGDYATGCYVQGCDDNARQLGALWLQNVSGAAPVKLTKLTDTTSVTADQNVSYEPTFNPVERGGYFWVVFTSSRDWGNKITGTPNNGKKRLWVAAIDKAGGTVDPSHPPFFLEGQEENTTNMRGFWALAACIPTKAQETCAAGFECCSGFCDKGVCVDSGQVACKGVGEKCGGDAECCNFPSVKCVAGTCQAAIPR